MSVAAQANAAAQADARRATAALGVSQALERLCDTHAGIRVAPAFLQMKEQLRAVQERIDAVEKEMEQRERSFQERIDAVEKEREQRERSFQERTHEVEKLREQRELSFQDLVEQRFKEHEELLAAERAAAVREKASALAGISESLQAVEKQQELKISLLEAKLGENATIVADCLKLSASRDALMTSLEERGNTWHELMLETGSRLQKAEATSAQSHKLNKRLLELATEVEPFATDMRKAQEDLLKLDAVVQGHTSTFGAAHTLIQEAHEAIAALKGKWSHTEEQLPELFLRVQKVEAEYKNSERRTLELAKSVGSLSEELTADRTDSQERWEQAAEVDAQVQEQLQMIPGMKVSIKNQGQKIKELAETKCNGEAFTQLSGIVDALAGEVKAGARTAQKRSSVHDQVAEETTELKAAVAGIVSKLAVFEEDLDDKVSKTTMQQVKTMMVNVATQVNEFKRHADAASEGGGGNGGNGIPSERASLLEARVGEIENELHGKAERTETSTAMNKVLRKLAPLEEQVLHHGQRLESMNSTLIRTSNNADLCAGQTTSLESAVQGLSRRMTECQGKLTIKADTQDLQDMAVAMVDFQSRVSGYQTKLDQLDQQLKDQLRADTRPPSQLDLALLDLDLAASSSVQPKPPPPPPPAAS